MKTRAFFLLAFLLWAAVSTVHAQDLSVDSRLDRSEIMIGQQAVIDLTVRTDDLEHTLLMLPPDSLVKHFEIISYLVTDTIDVDDKIKEVKAKMLITSFDSTLVEIPPFIVRNNEREARGRSLFLKVVLPEVDIDKPEEFYDIKSPWGFPYTLSDLYALLFRNPLSWLVIVLMLALVGWRLYRRYQEDLAERRARIPIEPEPLLSPKDRAIQSLQALSSEWGRRAIESKDYYTQLTDILRSYIDEAAAIPAPKMSSSQLRMAIKEAEEQAIRNLSDALSELLASADLVKFAKYDPSEQEAINGLKDTLHFIETADPYWQDENKENSDEETASESMGDEANIKLRKEGEQ